MRIISYNIHGARIAGRSTPGTQARAWHLLAGLGADLALVQEVQASAVPDWVGDRWDIVIGERGRHGKVGDWGSAIVANRSLNLRENRGLVAADPWLRYLYDYIVLADIDLPDGTTAVVASVHAVAKRLRDFTSDADRAGLFASDDEFAGLALGGDEPWVADLAFHALARRVKDRHFVVGGDWNNSRLFDQGRAGNPVATMFFSRATDHGWVECHRGHEERTWLRGGDRPYQLDHLFVDGTTGAHLRSCSAANAWPASELSDHAPLVADLDVTTHRP